MTKNYYAIEWINSIGKKVMYPEMVWRYKANAKRKAKALYAERLAMGIVMKDMKIRKLKP